MSHVMKKLIAVLSLYALSGAAQADTSVQADSAPDYCVGFLPEACSRIRSIVESKIRPDYCAPGFGLTDNGLNLTKEQLRICYALPQKPLSPEMERAVTKSEAIKSQRTEDARAAVRESWENYRGLVEAIETGFQCEVIDPLHANVSILKIEDAMYEEQIQAGLIGDPKMSVKSFTAEAVQTGKSAAAHGACARLTPAWRGRLRSMVSNLMR